MTPYGPNLKKNDSRVFDSSITLAEREAIVAQVTEEFISPAELANRHGISISAIRGWVKTAGKKLPSRYKTTATLAPSSSPFHLHRITQPEPPSEPPPMRLPWLSFLEPPPPTRPPASRRDPRLNKNATTSTGMSPKIFVRKDLFENSSKPQPEVPVPHALKVPPQQNLGNIGIEEADVQINPNDYVFEIDTTKIKLEIKTEVKVEKE